MNIFRCYNRILRKIKRTIIIGQNNNVRIKSKRHNVKIIIHGCSNSIEIENNCILNNIIIDLSGNFNHLIIKSTARLLGPCKIVMGGNSTLVIDENAGVRGVEFLLHNADIYIGKSCMFSYGIIVRNHDSHKVIDTHTNKQTNKPKNITIGNHVWIGQNSTILKGVTIGDNSIVAMGSIVTKGCEEGCILAGNPAKVVKENINWDY